MLVYILDLNNNNNINLLSLVRSHSIYIMGLGQNYISTLKIVLNTRISLVWNLFNVP